MNSETGAFLTDIYFLIRNTSRKLPLYKFHYRGGCYEIAINKEELELRGYFHMVALFLFTMLNYAINLKIDEFSFLANL